MACEEGYEDVVRVFLESGVSTDEPSSSRKTSKSRMMRMLMMMVVMRMIMMMMPFLDQP